MMRRPSSLIFIAIAVLFSFGCTHAPTSSVEREPAALEFASKMNEPCRVNSDCASALICRANRCRPSHQKQAEAGEAAANVRDCRSGAYDFNRGECKPAGDSLFANGKKCSGRFECMSQSCNFECEASGQFQGLPGDKCRGPHECLSKLCSPDRSGFDRCEYGGLFAASCAPVGTIVNASAQCCSGAGSLDQLGQCIGVRDERCSGRGDCRGRVGKTCADVGQSVQNAAQCCSLLERGGRCVINYSQGIFPCASDKSCPSGNRCDMSSNQCVP